MTLDIATHVCAIEHWLQGGAAVFALIAAIIWFHASRTKPSERIIPDDLGVPYGGPPPKALVTLVQMVIRQSRSNACAALFAGLSAICQVPLFLLPTCWSGSPWFLSN
jgi:hypothetical protein